MLVCAVIGLAILWGIFFGSAKCPRCKSRQTLEDSLSHVTHCLICGYIFDRITKQERP